MGVGRAAGKGKAEEAARMAISSPLLETSINGARGVLINVTGSMDIGLEEVEVAANLVQEAAHPDANIIFGAAFDESLEDEIRVTVIATGFEESDVLLDNHPFSVASAKVEEQREFVAPPVVQPVQPVQPVQKQPQQVAEPVPVQPATTAEKSHFIDGDWDILSTFFDKKR